MYSHTWAFLSIWTIYFSMVSGITLSLRKHCLLYVKYTAIIYTCNLLSIILFHFRNALKMYSRARDYCTSAKHIVILCLNIIRVSFTFTFILLTLFCFVWKVSIYLGNWQQVLNYYSKAEANPDSASEVGLDINLHAAIHMWYVIFKECKTQKSHSIPNT